MKRRVICLLLIMTVIIHQLPVFAADTGYTDVPPEHWAAQYIDEATRLGILNGMGEGLFGVGQEVTRAQFTAMLVRLFNFAPVESAAPSFSDNEDESAWYYMPIETAVANGAVLKDSSVFRPDDSITRAEMAVMLVRALGYDSLTSKTADFGVPFSDVHENIGYITIAYDFGIINGMTNTAFEPDGSATREQAAAMMMRLYDRYSAKIDWLHAFYAISSFSQVDSIPDMDSVSFCWSKLQYSEEGGPALNTTPSDGNVFCIPSGYELPVQTAQGCHVPTNLNVYMSTAQTVMKSDGTESNACREILLDSCNRASAIAQIVSQLNDNSFYSGVTIDFEAMSGAELSEGLVDFLDELRTALDGVDKTIYVCVPPVISDGHYYNAYQYRAIGELCDKVILMAHDYQATSMAPNLMEAGFTATPLTPLSEVYYALRSITDPMTGVQDTSKVALAVSFNTEQWQLQDGKVINSIPYHPDTESVYQRLIDDRTTMNYSTQYDNAYLTFSDESGGTQNVLWYEDERSIAAKLDLAKMFGVTSISIWRLGLIPDYESQLERNLHYNVLDLLMRGK
ncbi:hypothetical protein SDC9_69536 [bioreactor metagenome]|uniref:Uncharacterized protein n=1 Tax=bioreactor metagenome TaxID=1076179 RepID=A0A644Y916_9ZZZZ